MPGTRRAKAAKIRAGAFAAALAAGAALYWAVERPFLRLRDRLEGPSRSSIAVAPAAP
jgi:peptidoglycan/LPS O-acetylase OafA/YrhL